LAIRQDWLSKAFTAQYNRKALYYLVQLWRFSSSTRTLCIMDGGHQAQDEDFSGDENFVAESPGQDGFQDFAHINDPQFAAGVFIGLVEINGMQGAFFISNLPNEDRRPGSLLRNYFHAYFIKVPRNYVSSRTKFVNGVPYKFSTLLQKNGNSGVYNISCKIEEILPLKLGDVDCVAPMVRGSFIGSDGKFSTFKVTELPVVKFFGDPHIQVFQDQASAHPNYRLLGDSLLTTRAGFAGGDRPFPCVTSIFNTVHLGNLDQVPIRDIPSLEFVSGVCKEFKVQIIIGGCDDADLLFPIISNKEILLLGGISKLLNISEFLLFVCHTLSWKYPKETTPQVIYSKVESFIEAQGVRAHDRHGRLWAGMHEGMDLGAAHELAKILAKWNCNPLVITCANGLTMCVPDEHPLEVNAELFPPNLYEAVYIVSGSVPVSNPTFDGKRLSNKGSRNTVRYLIGRPYVEPKKPWEFTSIVPEIQPVTITEGTYEKQPDYNSDDQHISPQSVVIIIQSRKAKQLCSEIDKHRLCSYDYVRNSSAGARWAFISILPRPNRDPENLKKLLEAKHVFHVPTALIARPSNNNGVGFLKTSPFWSYRKNTPLHLDFIGKYRTPNNEKPIYFPVSNFHVKIIFQDNSAFPDFIQYLRDANKKIRSTWFTAIRYDGRDHNLFIGKEFAPRPVNRAPSRASVPERNGNFIVIEGLPLICDTNSIIRRINEIGIKVVKSFWGKTINFQHRFIIEAEETVDALMSRKSLLPEQIHGVGVDFVFTNSVEEWEDATGLSSLTAFKFLDDASPALDGALAELFMEATKRFQDVAAKANNNVEVKDSGDSSNRSSDSDATKIQSKQPPDAQNQNPELPKARDALIQENPKSQKKVRFDDNSHTDERKQESQNNNEFVTVTRRRGGGKGARNAQGSRSDGSLSTRSGQSNGSNRGNRNSSPPSKLDPESQNLPNLIKQRKEAGSPSQSDEDGSSLDDEGRPNDEKTTKNSKPATDVEKPISPAFVEGNKSTDDVAGTEIRGKASRSNVETATGVSSSRVVADEKNGKGRRGSKENSKSNSTNKSPTPSPRQTTLNFPSAPTTAATAAAPASNRETFADANAFTPTSPLTTAATTASNATTFIGPSLPANLIRSSPSLSSATPNSYPHSPSPSSTPTSANSREVSPWASSMKEVDPPPPPLPGERGR
jgi:hypothetical protein